MKKVLLPNSDVSVTPLTFGAWAIGGWMWGGAEEKDSIKAIEASIDNGISTIDTAPVYGFGYSEELVAKAIKGKRDKVEILTKYGLRWDIETKTIHLANSKDNDGKDINIYRYAGKESVIKECEDCLKRLKTDYIDLFQQHWPDPDTPIDETMEALDILKSQGKIKAGGVSNFSVDQMKAADKKFTLSTNQVPYSMVFRGIEKDLVPYSVENNKGIIVYSPLQRGILTGKVKPGYKFGEGDHRPGTPHYQEPNLSAINRFLDEIRPIAQRKNATLAQLVINWTLNQKGISCVLVGARNDKQVIENIMANELNISSEEMDLIGSKLSELKLSL